MKCAMLVPSIPDGNTTPLLGPLSLLALLSQQGHQVRLFDARFEPDVLSAVRQFAPDFLGVSAVTAGWPNGLRMASQYKQENPRCLVAVGGPHPSTCRRKRLPSRRWITSLSARQSAQLWICVNACQVVHPTATRCARYPVWCSKLQTVQYTIPPGRP